MSKRLKVCYNQTLFSCTNTKYRGEILTAWPHCMELLNTDGMRKFHNVIV